MESKAKTIKQSGALTKVMVGSALCIFAFVMGWGEYLWQVVATKKSAMFTLPIGVSIVVGAVKG